MTKEMGFAMLQVRIFLWKWNKSHIFTHFLKRHNNPNLPSHCQDFQVQVQKYRLLHWDLLPYWDLLPASFTIIPIFHWWKHDLSKAGLRIICLLFFVREVILTSPMVLFFDSLPIIFCWFSRNFLIYNITLYNQTYKSFDLYLRLYCSHYPHPKSCKMVG